MRRAFDAIYKYPLARFLAVGVSNFVVTYAVYLAVLLVVEYRIAFAISFVAGLLYTSILTIRHTFLATLTVARVAIYGAYYIVYFFVNIRSIQWLVEDYAVGEKWAPLITLAVLTPIHFLVSRLLVTRFKRSESRGPR